MKFPHQVSSGLLLEVAAPEVRYFLGHSRNSVHHKSYEACLTEEAWTIPKGRLIPGEVPVNAAIRETYEETGIHIYDWLEDAKPLEFFTTYTTSDLRKVVHVYKVLLPRHILTFRPFCASMVDNPKVKWHGLSELDAFGWFTKEEAQQLVFKTQKSLFN